MRKRIYQYMLLSLLTGFFSIPLYAQTAPDINKNKILSSASGLSPKVLDYAVNGYHWALAHGQVNNPNVLTIVDFSKPSSDKRLWVIDLRNNRTLMNTYTTHGSKSGDLYATQFSNRPGSDQSSLGVFKTLNVYGGKHGMSERLQGLEPGINNNALQRAIVVHPANYVTSSFIAAHHQAGRSWGCFAVDPAKSAELINFTKNGTVLFAYAPPESHDPVVA
jgi:hypothetical protein